MVSPSLPPLPFRALVAAPAPGPPGPDHSPRAGPGPAPGPAPLGTSVHRSRALLGGTLGRPKKPPGAKKQQR